MVLVFDKAGIRIAQIDDGQLVGSPPNEMWGDVKFCRRAGVFVHANGSPININIIGPFATRKMDDHALVLPAWVYLKLCAINAGWVFIGHGGRWVGKWHLHIGVMGAHCHAVERRVQQLHRPIARHCEGDPRRIRVAKPGG